MSPAPKTLGELEAEDAAGFQTPAVSDAEFAATMRRSAEKSAREEAARLAAGPVDDEPEADEPEDDDEEADDGDDA